jgi:ABC-type nitrate/sulfonate/bicarbonate transport system permease component
MKEQLRIILLGVAGSCISLAVLWHVLLLPLGWPPLALVLKYFGQSTIGITTYIDFLATGTRAILAVFFGFSLALAFCLITGRSRIGWILFFFLLLLLQKIPAVALVHVFVSSRLGLGLAMSVSLAATVVFTFTWLVLHHRAESLNARETFALRLVGFRGISLIAYGLLPHLGATLGAAARLGVSIALVVVVIGEWQGLWDDGTFFSNGLGFLISKQYLATDSEARVLASCIWLGLLGILLDYLVCSTLWWSRRLIGISFLR